MPSSSTLVLHEESLGLLTLSTIAFLTGTLKVVFTFNSKPSSGNWIIS